ncbi:MAG: flavodoxin-dependent (E)-4-hydroxy-3-methylbut-2-enyl-diphosphate synthase [Puniceicoccales bacterium]|jgi:(E)-4-hydroxy-3-methylbut-2-enyl-diphosphate synthase|nr:flavodoxin-dependent (E)-4-hydroxy-3-methylbut-2-enyl-diphosphate synthase [Puniceicoccales bacterium]
MESLATIHSVPIGKWNVGGGNAISIQTMMGRGVENEISWRRELEDIAAEGCHLVRVAIPSELALQQFQRLRRDLSCDAIAFIGDVHFQGKLAIDALEVCEKIRINPGNFASHGARSMAIVDKDTLEGERKRIEKMAKKFFSRARECNCSVRIGSNGGSLSNHHRMSSASAELAAIASVLEMVQWAEEVDLKNLVASFKWSDPISTLLINEMAREKFNSLGKNYPFHLGVTEAGNGLEARIKNAIAVGILLSKNIGDTLRLSLTEKSVNEIRFAKKLLDFLNRHRLCLEILKEKSKELLCQLKKFSDEHWIDDLQESQSGSYDDEILGLIGQLLSVENANFLPDITTFPPWKREAVRCLLQIFRLGRFHGEIIACPTCGRTQYNVAETLDHVRRRFSRLKHLKIAVMGCVVNGPGEMSDADYGYIGSANGKVNIYHRGQCVRRGIDEAHAIDALEEMIRQNGDDCVE